MYTGNIIWQHSDFLRLIKFLVIETLSLTNHFIMNPSNIASAFVQLDHYLDTINNTIDSTSAVTSAIHTPSTTASSDYFAILEEVENQTIIESTYLDIQYATDIDKRLEEQDATAVGLFINIIQATELIEHTAKLLPNLQHHNILLHLQRRIRNLAICLMPDDTKSIICEVVHEVCERCKES